MALSDSGAWEDSSMDKAFASQVWRLAFRFQHPHTGRAGTAVCLLSQYSGVRDRGHEYTSLVRPFRIGKLLVQQIPFFNKHRAMDVDLQCQLQTSTQMHTHVPTDMSTYHTLIHIQHTTYHICVHMQHTPYHICVYMQHTTYHTCTYIQHRAYHTCTIQHTAYYICIYIQHRTYHKCTQIPPTTP